MSKFKDSLETNQGVTMIMCKEIFKRACAVLLLKLLSEPQITMPYTENGERRILYKISSRGKGKFER